MDILLLGGLAATAAALWNQIKTVWFQLRSVFLVTFIVQYDGVEAFLVYLGEKSRRINVGPAIYHGRWMAVRDHTRQRLIAWEVINKTGGLYFVGKKPIWVSGAGKDNQPDQLYASHSSALSITYIRGTFEKYDLISEAFAKLNDVLDRENDKKLYKTRHFVRRIVGLSNKRAMQGMVTGPDKNIDSPIGNSEWDVRAYRSATPINYSREIIGLSSNSMTLDKIALSSGAENVIEEIRRWYISEMWYKVRHIPWKFGVMFYGDPGTGKTITARAIAEELDLPIYIFDLASMDNYELKTEWRHMLSNVPCIALLEDIDNVFDGRENLVSKDLTFDCLLNCIDGIERSDGLLVIVTTNKIEKVDVALGRNIENISINGDKMSSRPGRIDRIVYMPNPSKEGREKIANRILSGLGGTGYVVEQGKDDTGAQFQDRCIRYALKVLEEINNGG